MNDPVDNSDLHKSVAETGDIREAVRRLIRGLLGKFRSQEDFDLPAEHIDSLADAVVMNSPYAGQINAHGQTPGATPSVALPGDTTRQQSGAPTAGFPGAPRPGVSPTPVPRT